MMERPYKDSDKILKGNHLNICKQDLFIRHIYIFTKLYVFGHRL